VNIAQLYILMNILNITADRRLLLVRSSENPELSNSILLFGPPSVFDYYFSLWANDSKKA
jgi:hypothetical protein